MARDADEYEVVPYGPAHRADVLRLRTAFRGISPAWNAAHFRWQQEENPWFEGHLIHLALHRGEVVGMRVLHAAEWEVTGGPGSAGRRFRAPCYAGTVVSEGHRSRGLLSKLTRAVEEDLARRGVRFAFNLSAGPVTHVSALAEGWRSLGPFGALWRPRAIRGSRPHQRAARALRRLSAAVRWGSDVQLSREPRSGPMHELAAGGASRGRIRHVRDEAWFRWRFRDPSSRYLFAYLERRGSLAAYLVFHRVARPLRPGPLDLVDWERREDVEWAELLGAAARVADRLVLPLTAWRAAFPEEAWTRLEELRFAPRRLTGPLASSRPTFLVGRTGRPGDGGSNEEDWSVDGARVDEIGSWDLRPIYADAY